MMDSEKRNGHKDLLSWFVHDSNNTIGQIHSLIDLYLGKKDESYLMQAKMQCESALHMNSLIYNGIGASRGIKENLEIWAKSYPKVVLNVEEDFTLASFSQTRYMIAILSEVCMNAKKAGATKINITVKNKEFIISNNGAPIEDGAKIFDKGFSTFGTSGQGLSIIKTLCEWGNFTFSLIESNPVTFSMKFLNAMDAANDNSKVWHAKRPNFGVGGDIEFFRNGFVNTENFEMVGEFSKDLSLEEIFERTQNIDDHWNKEKPCRSTSIGDVIWKLGKTYRCSDLGWTEITEVIK